MRILSSLFFSFMKIGAFTIGGGYAMLPLIEREVVSNRNWINEEDFLEMIVVAQTAPGILAMNIAILTGNRIAGRKGAILSALGSAIPSVLCILIFAIFISSYSENKYFEAAFKAIRPAVVALIAVPTFNMAKSAKLNFKTYWIPLVVVFLIWYRGVSPIIVLLIAGFSGIALRFYNERRKKS